MRYEAVSVDVSDVKVELTDGTRAIPPDGIATNRSMSWHSTQLATLPAFRAGDIVFFAGKPADRHTRLGGWIMRSFGEGPTYAVHTVQFLDSHRVLEMDYVGRVKTIGEIFNRNVDLNTWQRCGFEVWRCRVLSEQQRQALTNQALQYVNITFGGAKMLAHCWMG